MLDKFVFFLNLLALTTTSIASIIAIYVFFKNKEKISSAIDLLINYSHQLTLSEIKEKIERLNEYNAKDPDECEKIINIFNELIGQIKGNDRLRDHFGSKIDEIESLASDKRKLTEPRKRAMISEIRERVRHMKISNIDGLIGETGE